MAGWQPQDWQPRERPLSESQVQLGVSYNTETREGTLEQTFVGGIEVVEISNKIEVVEV